jgi:hypothetical protein
VLYDDRGDPVAVRRGVDGLVGLQNLQAATGAVRRQHRLQDGHCDSWFVAQLGDVAGARVELCGRTGLGGERVVATVVVANPVTQ